MPAKDDFNWKQGQKRRHKRGKRRRHKRSPKCMEINLHIWLYVDVFYGILDVDC